MIAQLLVRVGRKRYLQHYMFHTVKITPFLRKAKQQEETCQRIGSLLRFPSKNKGALVRHEQIAAVMPSISGSGRVKSSNWTARKASNQ